MTSAPPSDGASGLGPAGQGVQGPTPTPSGAACATRRPLLQPELDFYALSRFADVDAAHRDTKTFSSAHGTVLEMMTPNVMEAADHDLHGPARPHPLPPAGLEGLHAAPHRRARGRHPHVCAPTCSIRRRLGRASTTCSDFGALVPAYVIAALLGVPPADRDEMRELIDGTFHLDPETGMFNDISAAAMGELHTRT